MNLEQRAARYFGLTDEPRMSIKTSRMACIVVARQRPSGSAICFYSEESGDPRANYMWLDADKREFLIAALSAASPRNQDTKEADRG